MMRLFFKWNKKKISFFGFHLYSYLFKTFSWQFDESDIPVRSQHCFNVYKTFMKLGWHCFNVKTTLCSYWDWQLKGYWQIAELKTSILNFCSKLFFWFQAFVFLGWICAVFIGLAVIYGPYWHAVRDGAPTFTNFERTIYGAFERLAWAVAVAWVIYACHNGAGGLKWKKFNLLWCMDSWSSRLWSGI